MLPGGRGGGDVGSFPCGPAVSHCGEGRHCGPEAGRRASQAWSGRVVKCSSGVGLGVLTEVAVVCPTPCPPGGDRELSPWQ